MKQVQFDYTSGSSEKTMSVGSIIQAFLDNPRAHKPNAETLLAVSKWKYKSRRKFGFAQMNVEIIKVQIMVRLLGELFNGTKFLENNRT